MNITFLRRRFVVERTSMAVRVEWYAPRGRGWTLYFWGYGHWAPSWPRRTLGGWNIDLGLVELFLR